MDNNTTRKFEAAVTPANQGVSDAEFEKVFRFLQAHQAKLGPFQAKYKEAPVFGTDVNGTLTDPTWGPLIDRFLADMHDRGASVKIVSGMPCNNLERYEIAHRLAQGDLSKLEENAYLYEPWFLMKAFALSKAPSFLFDDEEAIGGMINAMKGTFIRIPKASGPPNPELEIFQIWSRMSETQKDVVAKNLLGDAFRKPGMAAKTGDTSAPDIQPQ